MATDLQDWVGKKERRTDRVDHRIIDRFCATLGVATPSRDAPDGIHWCVCLPDTPTDALGPDGHPPKGGFLPPIDFPRRMWASSSVEFKKTIPIGAKISRVSTICSVTEKSGRSGDLVFVDIDHATSVDGVDAIVERQTVVYRDQPTGRTPLPEVAPKPGTGNWTWRKTVIPDERLLFRYSSLTFNTHRIHYDAPYAIETEQYPALVVQGPLIATLLLNLCTEHLSANPLARFSFKGVAPAFVGQPLHFVGEPEGKIIILKAFGGDGRAVMEASALVRS